MASQASPLLSPGRADRRADAVLVGLLALLVAAAWIVTADRMRGMDMGPNTDPGSLGFFTAVWVLMMAAMMFPSAAPMVAVYGRVSRAPGNTAIFVTGYLLTWTVVGLLGWSLAVAARDSGAISWDGGGRYVVAAILAAAAAYQLTPLKDRCVTNCRSPIAFVLNHWHAGRPGALRMGVEHGAWCVGCCWALMASLFALGVMSLAWMVVVAVLIAGEKLLPWKVAANRGIALLLLVLGVAVLVGLSP
jgi:predicted metal-binding membrane protein